MPSYTPPLGSIVDLVFVDAYLPPNGATVDLEFGKPPTGQIHLSITGTLENVTGNVSLHFAGTLHEAALDATLDDCTAEVSLLWDSGIWRGIVKGVVVDSSVSTIVDSLATKIGFNQSTRVRPIRTSAWQAGTLRPRESKSGWLQPIIIRIAKTESWQPGQPGEGEFLATYKAAPRVHTSELDGWQIANPHSVHKLGHYTSPPRKQLNQPSWWEVALASAMARQSGYGLADKKFSSWKVHPWELANPHTWIWGGWPLPPIPPTPPFEGSPDLVFYQTMEDYTGGAILEFNKPLCWAWPILFHPPGYNNPGYIIVQHNLTVTRVSDNVNVPVLSVSMRFDIANWAWQVSLNLETSQIMALVEPINGEPRTVRIGLDGVYVYAIIEEWGESRTFGVKSYNASGRSPVALLSQPYAPLNSYSSDTQQTASQLIDRELLNTGWSAQYHGSLLQLFTTDWLVPAGAWSYQNKSPIEAITQIAKAVGARAYADRTSALVHIAPRYKDSPWAWAAAIPDKVIPTALIRSVSTQLAPQPSYNHIIVSGTTQGVQVSATLAGTGGDNPAPMITDSLITFVGAGTERARNEFSNTGKQARVTLDLPMNSVTGLIEPGQLLEISETIPWRGIATSVSVSMSEAVASQQVEIERHY